MCQFGNESNIIEELDLPFEKALVGFRENRIQNAFNEKEKFLKSLIKDYIWKKGMDEKVIGLNRENSLGYYNYNDNNYYYYDNYNYHNYYYNNNHNDNYYNYYNINIKTLLWGKIFKYRKGYRSEFCRPTHFAIFNKNSKWFSDEKTKAFASHFNLTVENLAKEYKCEVVLEFKE